MRNRNYSRNKSYDFIPFFLFPIFGLSLYFSTAFDTTTSVLVWRTLTITFLVIYLVVFNFSYINQILLYSKHKNLEKDCTYEILGWKRFCENSIIKNNNNWFQNVSITIKTITSISSETQLLISNACISICEDCNTIENEFEGAIQNWKYLDYKLYGSANCSVIGILHRLMINDLNEINKNDMEIISVEFVFSNKINKHKKAYNEAD